MFHRTILALLVLLRASASFAADISTINFMHPKHGTWVTVTPVGCDKKALTDGKGAKASCPGMTSRFDTVVTSLRRVGYEAKTSGEPTGMFSYEILVEGKNDTYYIVQTRGGQRQVSVREVLADRELPNIALRLNDSAMLITTGIIGRSTEFSPPPK